MAWKPLGYCQKIQNDDNAMVGIAEKPQPYLPVLADVDLKLRMKV